MKILLCELLCLIIVVQNYADGQVIAPVEWEEQAPRLVQGNYLSRGWCRFTFSDTYQSGEFKVNVTFDKELSYFNDFNNWKRLASEPGFWYYSESKWTLNNGQEQRIEFNTKWSASSGIERPNGECMANVGTASFTTTQSTTSVSGSTSTSTAASTTTYPATTRPAAATRGGTVGRTAPPVTTMATPECGMQVYYKNNWTESNINYGTGECIFQFDEFIPQGDFKVNVSFGVTIFSFDDFGNMEPISADAGTWYYGRSKWPFNANQEWGYSFTVSWAIGEDPTAMCYTNLDCGDMTTPRNDATSSVPEVTTTSAQPTTTSASEEQTTTVRVTSPPTTASSSGTTTTKPRQTTTESDTTTPNNDFPTFNYADVIDKSMDFFAAQRSGALPDNIIPWRGDSALGDVGDNGEDLTGGYYDAGDHVKFNFPIASSMTLLAWGQYVFSDVYEDYGLSERMRNTIKWGLDYFLKCWKDGNSPKYYGQVGNGYADHAFWGRPEEMTMARPAFSLTPSNPGSDLAAETASALAAGSLLFRGTDPAYSPVLLDAARGLYRFANQYRGIYSSSIQNAASFYSSTNYNDELMLSAIILYEVTGESSYLTDAMNLFPTSVKQAWALSWDDKNVLAQLIMYNITGNAQYREPVDNFLARYRGDIDGISVVDGVLAWRDEWAPLRYSANAAMVAVLAADSGIDAGVNVRWAQSQIDYMLGNNPKSFSYVIGVGDSFPRRPHHRSSSCPDLPDPCSFDQLNTQSENPQILTGALVGGPDLNGNFQDDRNNFQRNEVACDYNAGFTSALAGLAHFRSMLQQ